MCYLGAAFRPRTPPLFGWKTRKLSATNQQWSLWLYTKHLMDMFSRFWIRKSLTFGKYSIFHPLWQFSTNNFTSRNATLFIFSSPKRPQISWCVPNFLFSEFYLNLLFHFKIGLSLGLSCLMSSMFIIILITRIIKTTWEVYNRYFWDSFFTCNFQVNKRAYLQTLRFLPISTDISMTPIHTKK